MNDRGFDVSAVTVTGVETTSDLRSARVLVSIRGTPEKQQEMMQQIAGHRKEIQEILGENVILKYTPRLSFELDPSIARGDHVLRLIAEIEEGHPEWKKDGGKEPTPSA
jgi:ribosome-binding factor A